MIEVYGYLNGKATNLQDKITLEDLDMEGLKLHGMVIDENDHLWAGVSDSEAGFVVEINPETKQIISKIGKFNQRDIG